MKKAKTSFKTLFLFTGLISLLTLSLVIVINKGLVDVTSTYCKKYIKGHNKKNVILKKCTTGNEEKAAHWLLDNMTNQYSYNNTLSQKYLKYLRENDSLPLKKVWLQFNPQIDSEPELCQDIQEVPEDILISNIRESIDIWEASPWHENVCFDDFCKFILPYKINKEPIVDWKSHYREKHSFIITGIQDMREAFLRIHEFEIKNFPVIDTYYPYEQDPILLDELRGGNCRQRAYHMAYVMRALGVPVAVDYTPFWANYGENGHFWVSLIDSTGKVITAGKQVEGTYEPCHMEIDKSRYTSSIDSLKKISKIYRLTFEETQNHISKNNHSKYDYLTDAHTYDVTEQYTNVTTQNIVQVNSSKFSNLYVCTYTQSEGWIPVGKAHRSINGEVNIGPLLDDNIVIVAEYNNGNLIPVSSAYLISHDKSPMEINPVLSHTRTVDLHRKYLLRTTWLNRWNEIIGTRIETSDDSEFKNSVYNIHTFNNTPISETITINLGENLKKYIRILPKADVYPVFAELQLLDKDNHIIKYTSRDIYAVGGKLTGDTIVTGKLFDDKLSTTFFKRFPFWIGFNLESINGKIDKLRIIMWNDENQIQPSHNYELFYFNNGIWNSLGRKTAESDHLVYNNVPENALLLLRDYTHGKEERIFMYNDNKQIWY
ncbi:MAG: transglutaminase-like domain-containing protein [Muribaculaceae bacterium]|nr:transglutaminase-like domain-containing protein [Muribaculaceae bacterium]